MSEPLRLYSAPDSCAFAPHVALEEAGADFEIVYVNLAEGQQRGEKYREVNPHGRVPALRHGDVTVTEVPAILGYLDRLFPDARLLPGDPDAFGRALELMAWLASSVHPAFAQVFRSERFTTEETAFPALKAGGKQVFTAALAEIEALLADGRTWILGETFSVVDPYVFVFWRWGPRLGLAMDKYPGLQSHAARVAARPAVERALAREQSENDH